MSFGRWKWHTAKKRHACCYGHDIAIGHRYVYSCGANGAKLVVERLCYACAIDAGLTINRNSGPRDPDTLPRYEPYDRYR